MQSIKLIEGSLSFTVNKQKYLFLLTPNTILLSPLPIIILPSVPYYSDLRVFGWQIELLQGRKDAILMVKDNHVRKQIEKIVGKIQGKWQANKMIGVFQQQNLWKTLKSQLDAILNIKKQVNALVLHHPCYNSAQTSLVIPIIGASLLLIYKHKVIIIDPPVFLESILQSLRIPWPAVCGVILTNPSLALNCLPLMLSNEQGIKVIAEEDVYLMLKGKVGKILGGKGINRLKGRIIRSRPLNQLQFQQKPLRYKFQFVEISLIKEQHMQNGSDNKNILGWEIYCEKQLIKMYPKQISHFPQQITSTFTSLIICPSINQNFKAEIQQIPSQYRQKIFINRPIKKYNHKYFARISQAEPWIIINKTSIQSKSAKKVLKRQQFQDWSKMIVENDENGRWEEKQCKAGQKINCTGKVIHVQSGYVSDGDRSYEINDTVTEIQYLTALTDANLLIILNKTLDFYSSYRSISEEGKSQIHIPLLKVKGNSFIAGLKKQKDPHFYQKSKIQSSKKQKKINQNPTDNEEPQTQVDQIIDSQSQFGQLSSIAKAQTYESGMDLSPENIYFLIKGHLKFKNTEQHAMKGMCIHNFKAYLYLDQPQPIEAVKDTWVIAISFEKFVHFMQKWPQKGLQLCWKGKTFS